jgi:Ca-activated chloride channel family protein
VIILITDGIEACDEDPCVVSRNLQKKGIILKPFVIGIGLDVEFKQTFECVGNYYDAADEETFEQVLGVVISQALDNTTAQINLLDIYGNPTETNVAITLTDKVSGEIKDQFIHTLNFRGNPDTVILDPLVNYHMTVHTIPEVHLDSITIYPGTHTHIGVDAPQGTLVLRSAGNRNDNVKVIVRKHGEMKTINVQTFKKDQDYIVGKYDLEFLTLPRIYQTGVEINQSTQTKVVIPPPGSLNIQSPAGGYGSILVETKQGLEWVTDLDANSARQSFQLQPGQYRVVFRSKKSQQTAYSKAQRFSITSGKTTILRLN